MENVASNFTSIEARSLATLHLKVAAHQAAGWVNDGPLVVVTDYYRNGRAVKRYSQAMYRHLPRLIRWASLL